MAIKAFPCLIFVLVLLALSSPECHAFGNGALAGKRSFQEKRVTRVNIRASGLVINFLVHICVNLFLNIGQTNCTEKEWLRMADSFPLCLQLLRYLPYVNNVRAVESHFYLVYLLIHLFVFFFIRRRCFAMPRDVSFVMQPSVWVAEWRFNEQKINLIITLFHRINVIKWNKIQLK